MIPKRNLIRRSSLTRIVIKFENFKKKKKKINSRKLSQQHDNSYGHKSHIGNRKLIQLIL